MINITPQLLLRIARWVRDDKDILKEMIIESFDKDIIEETESGQLYAYIERHLAYYEWDALNDLQSATNLDLTKLFTLRTHSYKEMVAKQFELKALEFYDKKPLKIKSVEPTPRVTKLQNFFNSESNQ